MSSCQNITEACVQEAFLAAPPAISSQILDLTIKHPNWCRDLYQLSEWPRGSGTIQQQLVFKGERPAVERGFANWKKLSNTSNYGCDTCAGPDCGYSWTQFGGHGFDRKVIELMRREFKSPSYCISEIQTTANFAEVFAKIVENLYGQVDFFKEMNIGLNILTGLAKKYVVDSDGAKPNLANPYVYPNIGNARISTLGMLLLEFFYEHMRRLPDAVPYSVTDGSPTFAIITSHQMLARLYRDDAVLRQDVRYSSSADDLVSKYNFTSTLRGMFFPVPILYPRRFDVNAQTGEWEEVLPFINGVPAEIGSYADLNPEYEAARYEEAIIHGKYPFGVKFMPTENTLGQNTSFGPEDAFMNTWQWVNPQTVNDPFRRVGYFATSASIGIDQQFSSGIYAIMLERPKVTTMAVYVPEPECPPDPVVCDNSIPSTGCPCPLILSVVPNPVVPGNFFVTMAVPVDTSAEATIQFGLASGAYITGTVVAVSEDGYSLEVQFASGVTVDICTQFTTIYCDDTLGCSSDVLSATDCRSGETDAVRVVLKQPIKAITAADIVLATFGDCSTAELAVVAVDLTTNTWVLRYGPGFGPSDDPTGEGFNTTADLLCDRCGIISVCVPPTTDATCPPCVRTFSQCQEES